MTEYYKWVDDFYKLEGDKFYFYHNKGWMRLDIQSFKIFSQENFLVRISEDEITRRIMMEELVS